MDKQTLLLEEKIRQKLLIDKRKAYEENVAMFNVVKKFIQKNNLLLYGGLALNIILPKHLQFYDEYEIPDYDFFSPDAKKHAKELGNTFADLGYEGVEVKPGLHLNTYKVFVNYNAVADITYVPEKLFERMSEISKSERTEILQHNPSLDMNIAPMAFLRMSLHLELSRPDGFIERWTKVYKRMVLFYHTYPLTFNLCKEKDIVFIEEKDPIFLGLLSKLKEFLTQEQYPIFGWEATRIYFNEAGFKLPYNYKFEEKMSMVDIIAEDYANAAKTIADYMRKLVEDKHDINIEKHSSLYNNEIIPSHFLIKYKNKILIGVYQSQACYAYKNYKGLRLSTIDTMCSLMYGWLFSERTYYNNEKIKCMINMLLNIQNEQLEKKKGRVNKIFTPFELNCYGYQLQLEDLKKQRMEIKNIMKVYRPKKTNNNKKLSN
jgi:hypothetical protein